MKRGYYYKSFEELSRSQKRRRRVAENALSKLQVPTDCKVGTVIPSNQTRANEISTLESSTNFEAKNTSNL